MPILVGRIRIFFWIWIGLLAHIAFLCKNDLILQKPAILILSPEFASSESDST